MTAAAMTPRAAAFAVRRYLIDRYALAGEPEINLPTVWSKERCAWGGAPADAGLVWESSEGADWAVTLCGVVPTPGVFQEPYSGYLLSFYKET